MKLLRNSNSKIKKTNIKNDANIFVFDLPAYKNKDDELICIGAKTCVNICYAQKNFYVMPSVQKAYETNYYYSKKINFPELIQNEIEKENSKKKKITHIRIHSSGDFFSKEYFLMWCNIAKKFPELKIFTYTKTPNINKNLIPSNLNIIDSFIKYNDKKYLNYGSYESMKNLAKNVKGLLCPITKGNHLKNDKLKALTCAVCKYCITKNKPTFIQH